MIPSPFTARTGTRLACSNANRLLQPACGRGDPATAGRPFARGNPHLGVGRWLVILGLALALLAVRAAETDPIANSECLDCHGQNDLTKTNAAGKVISLFVDEAALKGSVHATNSCAGCHSDLTRKHPDDNVPARPANCAGCHDRQAESYEASAHGLALKNGEPGAATCKDCHGSHDILKPTVPGSRMHFSRLAVTCGECHPEVAKDVQLSVHGRASTQGDRDAATCTDCHSEHRIEGLKGASPRKLSEMVCGKCHASERINTKFRLPPDRVKTFFESYHGLAVQGGLAAAANCASCHGYHRILPSSDPQSSIHKSHLVETCGKCHPGATENFALGQIHTDGRNGHDLGTRVNRWVRRVYLALIFITIGLMLAHNGLAWWKQAMAARRAAGRTELRMDRAQRMQHLILLTSFFLLALSGFALKYPDSWLAWLMGGDEAVRRWIHRGAGVILLVLGGWHVGYLIRSAPGRQLWRDMLPRRGDLVAVRQNLQYLRGRTARRPRFGRFGYPEKAEYWAVMWGTVIMGVTGLVIWLKIPVTQVWPRWVIDVAITVHYYEAILACLAILVWHFYHVMFSPESYPMNWAWFDGMAAPEPESEAAESDAGADQKHERRA